MFFFCVINLFECLFFCRNEKETFSSVLVLNLFISVLCRLFVVIKNELPLFFSRNFFLPREKFPLFSSLLLLCYFLITHTEKKQHKCAFRSSVDRQNSRRTKKERRRTNRKKLCFIYFSIFFFPHLISVCAFFLGSSAYTTSNMRTH